MWTVIWLVVLLVTLVVEFLTLGLTSVWFSGGAIVAVVLAMLNVPWYIQIIAFLVVSVVLLVLTRPIAVKYFNNHLAKTNVDSVIGQKAIVLEDINNLLGSGRVKIGGLEWTARSVNPIDIFEEGEVVKVESVDGVKVMVVKAEEE